MKQKRIFTLFNILIALTLFLYCENNWIGVTHIAIQSERLPENFDGFKIVHLSDLHNKMFGDNQQDLVSKINDADPDIILFTGDLVDSNNYREQPSLQLIDEIVGIAPVYYVMGNHEFWSGRFDSLEDKLKERGVIVLRNETAVIEKDGDSIEIMGIDDPSVQSTKRHSSDEKTTADELQKALSVTRAQSFKILLAHRPELMSIYSKYNIDLVFSGHAHGGQVRLPFIGGLAAPNQGVLPKYTSGQYREGDTTMVVSRGLGNSIIPQRVINRPEIIEVKLIKNNR